MLNLYSFLAVSSPVQADALVVEGWLADESLRAALSEFQAHPYEQLITTGGPLPIGFYLSEYKTYAELAAATLATLGSDRDKLIAVPAGYVSKDRTYAAALALKQWLDRSNSPIQTINLLTAGAHARRSWLLYRKALEPNIKVGIISVPDLDYDLQRWWTSSTGVRTIIPEAIAYLYARLFDVLE